MGSTAARDQEMPAIFSRFTNDIVSLAVLTLMVVAFVAGQAGATSPSARGATTDASAATEEVIAVDSDPNSRRIGE